ncbi:putative YigZ family protein [Nocardioides albertanoniae]|uniref:Putative YigZ family protein n=1 Tax=Nocardioides albertanoniae TaxID=1175486 RepID=A0A543ABL4_9ACTN|nr:YigZ family protein [Nocardioides albertanoniae]TQL69910.1 putative YigZ family protein [Nocardioides albertanoniae]
MHYLTIARDGDAEIEVKRSRFLCTLVRVADEAEARAVVERLRKEHWDARHTCSAFRIGRPPQPVERSNDDGEPAGTAGAPMLEVLRGAEVSDTVAVVTRWFGGTLLGAGGLVRAYSDAVRSALDEVGTLRRELVREYRIEVAHDTAGRLETDLRASGVTVLETSYGAAVTLRIGAPPAEEERLESLLAELTAGASVLVPGEDQWVDSP